MDMLSCAAVLQPWTGFSLRRGRECQNCLIYTVFQLSVISCRSDTGVGQDRRRV